MWNAMRWMQGWFMQLMQNSGQKRLKYAAVADKRSHSRVVYSIGMIKNRPNAKLADEFMDFMLSKEGQKILGKYGFRSISDK